MRWCRIHRGPITGDTEAVLISAVEQGSGPGIPIYACRPCADSRSEPTGEDAPVPYGAPSEGIRRAP
jgi:hypothetical protein